MWKISYANEDHKPEINERLLGCAYDIRLAIFSPSLRYKPCTHIPLQQLRVLATPQKINKPYTNMTQHSLVKKTFNAFFCILKKR